MTISDINSLTSFRANTNTTEYSAANRLISTNRWYHKIVTMILDAQDEWDWDDSNQTDYAEATTNLVASQQDYVFPGSLKLLKIKRVEVKIDGQWVKANPIDVNQILTPTDTATISANFDASEPYYDMTANAIKLYPIPSSNVTAGLKIWFTREPAEFTSAEVSTGTKEPGFDEPFHPMISLGMVVDWASAKNKPQLKADAQGELMDYEMRLRKHYGKKQQDRDYILNSVYDTSYGK